MAERWEREKGSGGSFIVVGSIGGLMANTVIGATASPRPPTTTGANLAAEWGPKNVRVNAIARLIRTEFARACGRTTSAAPSARPSPPQALGRAARHRRDRGIPASDAAAFITGQVIVADGGVTIV